MAVGWQPADDAAYKVWPQDRSTRSEDPFSAQVIHQDLDPEGIPWPPSTVTKNTSQSVITDTKTRRQDRGGIRFAIKRKVGSDL